MIFGLTIIVCGGRDYHERAIVNRALTTLHDEYGIAHLIEGDAAGADYCAALWVRNHPEIAHTPCPADWEQHGNSAGPRRNAEMLTLRPHLVVAFPGGRGTASMVRQARAAGVPVWTPLDTNVIPFPLSHGAV